MSYRVFVAKMGGFRDSSKYEFVAEFVEQKAVVDYVRYIFGKDGYKGKDIIIKKIDSPSIDPRDGKVDGVISAIGEELPIHEYDFK